LTHNLIEAIITDCKNQN